MKCALINGGSENEAFMENIAAGYPVDSIIDEPAFRAVKRSPSRLKSLIKPCSTICAARRTAQANNREHAGVPATL